MQFFRDRHSRLAIGPIPFHHVSNHSVLDYGLLRGPRFILIERLPFSATSALRLAKIDGSTR